ncbi:hypothetical protein [uncultured Dokdonia sp.]|uniref:hypothetical protein n=1 Tax=uncultured Dokdonia sp. TaxID=575653 RepID=UPI00260D6510|nr:hypothetical protein [uncultured Dokdonia sp.]
MIKLETFNEHFGIKSNATEHLNILMENDLEAFIDPYHIANNLDNMIAKKMYIRSKSFLETLNRTFIISNDRNNGLKFLSHLGEANEYHLGYSHNNKGKGIGHTKAEIIFDSLRANKLVKAGITVTNEAHNVLLLVKGIGQDNMSDTLANVCRDILAEFTFQQCLKYNIDVEETRIEYYEHSSKKWVSKKVMLPHYKGKCIILVPQFLTSGQRIYTNHYNWFISSNYLSKDILDGTINTDGNDNFINELKDGTKKAIIKNINNHYRKPKHKLIEYVKNYNGSLIDFQDYVKSHYSSIDIDKLIQLYGKAS